MERPQQEALEIRDGGVHLRQPLVDLRGRGGLGLDLDALLEGQGPVRPPAVGADAEPGVLEQGARRRGRLICAAGALADAMPLQHVGFFMSASRALEAFAPSRSGHGFETFALRSKASCPVSKARFGILLHCFFYYLFYHVQLYSTVVST